MNENTPESPIERRLRESLPEVSAPDALWERIEAERTKRQIAYPRQRRWLLPAGTVAVAAAAVLAFTVVSRPRPTPSGWTYKGKTLAIGETITAEYGIAFPLEEPSVGTFTLLPATRLKIIDTSQQKRLKLERGKISAVVKAPPRLFAVETGSGIATDLGCSYDLTSYQVPLSGIPGLFGITRNETRLRVKSGWVELADSKRRRVLVPAGASCHMLSGEVGIPRFIDASDAVRRLSPLPTGLKESLGAVSRPKDTLTLYYLLPRVREPERIAIWNRLLLLVPPTKGITKAALLAGDASAISAYEEDLKEVWNPPSPELWNQLINGITKGSK